MYYPALKKPGCLMHRWDFPCGNGMDELRIPVGHSCYVWATQCVSGNGFNKYMDTNSSGPGAGQNLIIRYVLFGVLHGHMSTILHRCEYGICHMSSNEMVSLYGLYTSFSWISSKAESTGNIVCKLGFSSIAVLATTT